MNAIDSAFKKAYAARDKAEQLLKAKVHNLDEDLPWKLVVHRHPDDDAFACQWGAVRRLIGKGVKYELAFIPTQNGKLPDEECVGYRVLYMDTGGGPLDQHDKGLKRVSSFQLMCKHYGWDDDRALWPIIDLTVATDNVEVVDRMSVHYVLSGLASYHRDHTSKTIDWITCCERAFEMFDILYGQEQGRLKGVADYKKFGKHYTLPNQMNVATVLWNPHAREAAYAGGADAVMWTVQKKRNRFLVGIQLNRNTAQKVEGGMQSLIAGLRIAEAKKRGTETEGHDLRAHRADKNIFGAWYLHDSKRLILCGSRSAPLEPSDYTVLTPEEILSVIMTRLGSETTWDRTK